MGDAIITFSENGGRGWRSLRTPCATLGSYETSRPISSPLVLGRNVTQRGTGGQAPAGRQAGSIGGACLHGLCLAYFFQREGASYERATERGLVRCAAHDPAGHAAAGGLAGAAAHGKLDVRGPECSKVPRCSPRELPCLSPLLCLPRTHARPYHNR